MIRVSVTKTVSSVPCSPASIRRVAGFVCRKESVKHADLSFIFVGNDAIRTMNKKFLRHDYITDVITFPLELGEVNAEIYINARRAHRQAKENSVTVKNELTRLVVHGTLHAIGYNDTTARSKKRMNSIQERYVSELSLK